ncbi:MAG: phosphatidylglycerol lysyltransferase domain-containing protein [Actinomycetota bacterium]|nr:phosphatidylglycerol lysyltransferase domain-containing protein [Actinomycetota bacterium]
MAGLLCSLIGILNLISGITPADRPRVRALTQVLPGTVSHTAAAATVVAGVLLLLLARALRRRKRRAWRAVVALLTLSVALHVVKGLDVEEAVIAALLLGPLLYYRREFGAKGDPRTRYRAIWIFALLLGTSVLLGFALIEIRERRIVGPHPFGAVLRHILLGLVGVEGPLRFRSDRTTDLVGQVLGGLGLVTALTTVYLILRPPSPRAMLLASEEERIRALLAKQGFRDSLGYFALRRDKSVVWSPSGKAVIAYRVVSGVMLASGDPIGDPEAWPGAVARFLDIAADHAWVPAVMGCSEAAGTAYARAGLSALEIGDEAIVPIEDFSLEGRAMRNVRQAVARVERAGYSTQVRRIRDIPPEEQTLLRSQAAAWRGAETERGFSMALGRFGDPADGDCVSVTATQETDDGPVLRAFLHFVPWGPDGLSLDLMRRDKAADNGLNEYLIVSALRAAPDLGVVRLSLNFAVFRSALERGERLGAGPVLRAWRGLLLFASRWFQIETLYRFNAKFRPVWEPRFVCYPAARDLPRIAIAALEAEAFIVFPRPSLARIGRLALGRAG